MAELRKRTVVVVGHMPWALEFCREVLAQSGVAVIVATSLRGALAAVVNHRPDAILSVNLLHYIPILRALLFRLATTRNAPRPPLIVWTAIPLPDAFIKRLGAGRPA